MNFPFFDFHCHPSFKSTFLNRDINQCPHPASPVEIQFNFFGQLAEIFIGDPLSSQSSFEQLPGGSLVVLNLLAMERVYAFADVFNTVKNLDRQIFTDVRNQTFAYNAVVKERDLAHLKRFDDKPQGLRSYKILSSIAEYPLAKNELPDPEIIYVIVAIEGGHNFYPEAALATSEANPQAIVDRFADWKQKSNGPGATLPRLLYVTLCHHGQNALATHAWAIPALVISNKVDKVSIGSFYPTNIGLGTGLNTFGEQFVRIALRETADEKRVLIDVKHMGLLARQQLYRLYRKEFPGAPIIATHMGVTGTSWNDPSVAEITPIPDHPQNVFIDYFSVAGFLRNMPNASPALEDNQVGIGFNPWSINLYNEDILEIMRSRGLIGVSADIRILGGKNNQPERFCFAELPAIWNQQAGKRSRVNEDLYPTEPLPDKAFRGNFGRATEEMWQFAQTVIHIVLVTELAKAQGNPELAEINPWDHICLGSDFDGLISTIKTCPTAAELPRLFTADFKAYLTIMSNHLNKFHGQELIKVPGDVLNRLSVRNGVEFLKQHFA